jgi:hypothetical protein
MFFPILVKSETIILTFHNKPKHNMKLEIFAAYIVATISLSSSCHKNSASTNDNEPCTIEIDSTAIASKLLTLSFAEKIMGEPAKLTCNSFIKKGDTLEYKCDYTSLSQDEITSKSGKLYFMYEVYASVTAAENAYTSIYQANSGNEGVEIVSGLGDKAYYHSDGTNFYFYLVRKNEKMFRLKLNKVTIHSSKVEFKEVTRLIADKI